MPTGNFASSRASEKEVHNEPSISRFNVGLPMVIAVALLAPAPAAGQSGTSPTKTVAAAPWTLPRTADGQPDLQGVWDFRTITPLERPASLGTKAFFTDEEAAKFEKDENQRQDRDKIDPEVGGLMYPPGGVVPYNEFWYDRGNKIVGTKRTSLIVDPPDGRLPAMTPEGKKRADAARGGPARDPTRTSPRQFVGGPAAAGALHRRAELRSADDARRVQQ